MEDSSATLTPENDTRIPLGMPSFGKKEQQDNDIAEFDVEKQLRSDRESFDAVRKLSPNRFRFRVLDNEGGDLRTSHYGPNDYTRVYCVEQIALYNVQKVPESSSSFSVSSSSSSQRHHTAIEL